MWTNLHTILWNFVHILDKDILKLGRSFHNQWKCDLRLGLALASNLHKEDSKIIKNFDRKQFILENWFVYYIASSLKLHRKLSLGQSFQKLGGLDWNCCTTITNLKKIIHSTCIQNPPIIIKGLRPFKMLGLIE